MIDNHEPPPVQTDEFGNYMNSIACRHALVRRRSLDGLQVAGIACVVFLLFCRLVWLNLR